MGRHKLEGLEAKKTVTLGIQKKFIEAHGGEEALKEKLMKVVENIKLSNK
jgi:hypothetical protein